MEETVPNKDKTEGTFFLGSSGRGSGRASLTSGRGAMRKVEETSAGVWKGNRGNVRFILMS